MEACSTASAATLTEFEMADVEGKPAKVLKLMVRAKLGFPRFKQRFCLEDSSREIHDELFGRPHETPALAIAMLAI